MECDWRILRPARETKDRQNEFQWDAPLLLERQLTAEERMARAAHAYCQEKRLRASSGSFAMKPPIQQSFGRWASQGCSAQPFRTLISLILIFRCLWWVMPRYPAVCDGVFH